MKAAVHQEKLAKFQRHDMHIHACAEESSVETGYNPTRFWFGVVLGFSLPRSPRRGGKHNTSQNFFEMLRFCMYFTHAKNTPHSNLKVVGQVDFLLPMFSRQKDINSVL